MEGTPINHVCIVQRVHSLSSPSPPGVFISQQILTKFFFVVFCAEILQQFSPTLLASCVFLSHSETLHCENKLAKKF